MIPWGFWAPTYGFLCCDHPTFFFRQIIVGDIIEEEENDDNINEI
jgi:hypothetical protein